MRFVNEDELTPEMEESLRKAFDECINWEWRHLNDITLIEPGLKEKIDASPKPRVRWKGDGL